MSLANTVALIKALIKPELSEVKNAIQGIEDALDLDEFLSVNFVNDGAGYVTHYDGEIEQSANFDHTNYIDLTGIKAIKYKRSMSTSSDPATGIAFYNSSKQYISGVQSKKNQQSAGYDTELYEVTVPQNAKYARFSIYHNITTYGAFELYKNNKLYDLKGEIITSVYGIKYAVAKTNGDGTKTIVKHNYDIVSSIAFNPIKNTDYVITAKNNDRLRVYGSKIWYDPQNIEQHTIGVDTIVESQTLDSVSFNSGEYLTIFVYLNTGNVTGTEYNVERLSSVYADNLANENKNDIGRQGNEITNNKNDILPFMPSSIPATAILYHAEWDDLVAKGLIQRSDPTYMSYDTGHLFPLYTYTIKSRNEYIDSNYDISQNELSSIYNRPKVLIVSGHHGDEPCTPWALLGFVKRILEGMKHYDIISQYEFTIIPLVNPNGFNRRNRTNGDGVDINRDYNDSTGFVSEEAQYVRDVFLDDDYAIALDLHQTPFNETTFTDRRLGFTSMNIKRASETQDEYDALRSAFLKNVSCANAHTDVAMMVRYGWKDIGQTAFIWESSNTSGNTFKNYTAGTVGNTQHTSHHTKITATLETSTRCAYLSGSIADYNDLTIQYTNEYADEIIRAVIKTYEDVS